MIVCGEVKSLEKLIVIYLKVASQNSHEENKERHAFLGGNILRPGRDII